MLAHIKTRAPDARITGFVVEEMAIRPHAHELLAGIAVDPTFGPIILFGQGGTAAEVIGDRAIGLPPLNAVLAREMIGRTHVSKLLEGFRDWPAIDFDAVALTLVRLSELVSDIDEVAELDINPLLADNEGVLALDARIVVHKQTVPAVERFAITPYPSELEHTVKLSDGFEFLVRPIRPEDEPALVDMVARSSPEDVRLRFLGPLKELPHLMAARFSQIDYSREMAFVAIDLPSANDGGEIYGVVRFIADPNLEVGEYAVMVRSDFKGRGLGWHLMNDILAYAKARGLKRLYGDVLRENATMLQMTDELGFTRSPGIGPDVVRVSIEL
jgi:acetyltransferase